MERLKQMNPYTKRESYSSGSVLTYKILTILSWLLAVVVSIWYTFEKPHDGPGPRRRIWDQNSHHPTGFSMNHVIASIYWIVLFLLQLCYVGHFFSADVAMVNAASNVASCFVLNNLFHFAFVMLFVRSFFILAEVLLVVNLVNLTTLHCHHNSYARLIHFPAVSGPLAWTFVAIFWNGAMMVPGSATFVARVFANIMIWAIFLFGAFYLVFYKDYTMGFSLSVLTAAIGVGQFFNQIIALQWIFAFTIMAVLFVASLAIAVLKWMGKEVKFRGSPPAPDAERAPLLAEA